MDFFRQIEQSAFFVWISSSGSLWGYPTVLFLHTLGLATVAGVNAAIDLRLLGFGRVALSPLVRFFPLIWAAFAITAASGTILLLADATTKLTNPAFYIKLGFVALALVNMQLIRRRFLSNPALDTQPLPRNAAVLAMTSLFFWIAATTAGRLMAYVGPVSGLLGLE
jgi:hypothetical protein